jgi:hypothetical protein
VSKNQYSSMREELAKADQANGRQVFPTIPKIYVSTDGKYRLRILPSNDKGSMIPFKIFKLHSYKNPNYPDSDKPAPWVCGDSGCPMCSVAFKTAKEEKDKLVPKDEKTAWKKFARSMAHYHVIDLEDDTVKILCADKNDQYENGLHDEIMREMDSLLQQDICPFDADDGRVLTIERRTVDGKKRYIVQFENESHSIPMSAQEKLKEIRPLGRLYWKNTNEELKKVLDGVTFGRHKNESSSESDNDTQASTGQPVSAAQSAKEVLFPDETVSTLPVTEKEVLDQIAQMTHDIFGTMPDPTTKK